MKSFLTTFGFIALFSATSFAATADGGTKTTQTLKYYPTGSQWVMRVDPENVEAFQLHVQFDPGSAAPDMEFTPVMTSTQGMGVSLRAPFVNLQVVPDGVNGFRVSGEILDPLMLTPGDVDIFEVRFDRLTAGPVSGAAGSAFANPPGGSLEDIKFTVFATEDDFLQTNNAGVRTRFMAAEIEATTRSAMPGVSPMLWDPDGQNNNGTIGGSGQWNTTSPSWDNLPTNVGQPVQSFPNVPWDNTVNARDEAVFGGNPGAGQVMLTTPITAGSLRFDVAGYTLQGQPLTLTAPPGENFGSRIDVNAEDARLAMNVNALNGVEKVGGGNLDVQAPLSTSAFHLGEGSVTLSGSGSVDLVSNSAAITFLGNATLGYEPSEGGSTEMLGALTFLEGDGNVETSGHEGNPGVLIFASLTLPTGSATGNFRASTFLFDSRIEIAPGSVPQDTFLSPRLFFRGADYAVNGSFSGLNFMRALRYGDDPNTSPLNTINPGTHVKLTTLQGPSVPSVSLRTLNLAASGNFSIQSNGTLTLTEGGLLKSAGGAATITLGGKSIVGGITTGGVDLVIRTDDVEDILTIDAPIFGISGLVKSGAGTLILEGANAFSGAIAVLDGTLLLNGAGSSDIFIAEGMVFGGNGSVGALSGPGTISPGMSPGILTATSLDSSLETDFRFEVTLPVPIFGNAEASGNDVLRLTSADPFAFGLCAPSEILIDFQVPALADGAVFLAGFYTDSSADLSAFIESAAFTSTLNGGRIPDGLGVEFVGMVPQTADFGDGPVMGRIMQLRVIPEPQTCLLLASALGLLARRRRGPG